MPFPKLILTDIDETILEFANPFQEWITKKGFKTTGRLRDNYKIEEWLGVERSAAVDLMTEFNRSDPAYLKHAEPDALEILPKLYAEGWRFVGITACGTDPVYSGLRINILAEVFGFPFEGVHYVEHRATKRDVLGSFRPAVWVEDNLQHAIDGGDLGHFSFLLDRPYNGDKQDERFTNYHRVKSWHDIYETVSNA